MVTIQPRPSQQEILDYRAGKMGISAVPGSGKTWTLSRLAADIIASDALGDDQEVLIVTLTNSAVDNFKYRIDSFLKGQERRVLIPKYRVRTLHGLAHDLVRERPELVNLDTNFQIMDDRVADGIRSQVAEAWLRGHPDAFEEFLNPDLEASKQDWIRREKLPVLVEKIALSFIRSAKDMQLTPERLRTQLERLPVPLVLAEMGCDLYADYQRALAYQGAVDFDDLVRLGVEILQQDEDLLERLRDRWPFIFEDEAQDSSRLQEKILRKLVGPFGNWIRVGDPNQAIYETFTTANPNILRSFLAEDGVVKRDLPNSGRSTMSIISLANYLIDWTRNEHKVEAVRDALSTPCIEPSPPGDPQPNPADDPTQVLLIPQKLTPQEELNEVADSIVRWLPQHPEKTVAVLAPRNVRAQEMVEELKKRKIEVVESLLQSTISTRSIAGALANMLRYLADPKSSRELATVYRVWRRADRNDPEAEALVKNQAELIRKCPRVEDFLWPQVGGDWLVDSGLAGEAPQTYERLIEFREQVNHWQRTVHLPIDQIILTLAQGLFSEPTELAVAHKLAVLLRRANDIRPEWWLPELKEELALIARNERRFLGLSEDDTGFDPDKYKGQVVVATVHKAKGLEWDRVYLISVNNYDFPSAQADDKYISEPWFIRSNLNLEAEALAQLRAIQNPNEYDLWYQEGKATQVARLDYVRERLRLLFVGITRARKEMVITWNTGRKGNLQPAMPLVALQAYWKKTSR